MTEGLYEDVVLDHNKHPRNFGSLEQATHVGEGRNPLCGDYFTVRVRLEDDRLAEIRFEGSGCAIARASASLMTCAVTGRPRNEVSALASAFEQMLVAPRDDDAAAPLPFTEALEPLSVFVNVRAYPMRIKCALLPWKALMRALGGARDALGL
jgi:nitrogen fixation protein NifU and related proteins